MRSWKPLNDPIHSDNIYRSYNDNLHVIEIAHYQSVSRNSSFKESSQPASNFDLDRASIQRSSI